MRTLAASVVTALSQRALVARDFLWIVVRDRVTGDPVTDGYWSDVGPITAPVVNPLTGASVSRSFFGAGSLIEIEAIPLTSTLTVKPVRITLSQVEDRVQDLIRGYDAKQARVEVFRGLFNPHTRALVAPAFPRFVGFVDEIEVATPAEGQAGGVSLRCVSHLVEITRANPDTRSDASQRRRSATDNFFQDVSTAGDLPVFWGTVNGRIPAERTTAPKTPPATDGEVFR